MKPLLIASICALTTFPALALDERSAARLVRDYSETVACQIEDASYQAALVQEGDAELSGLGTLYVVAWTGDRGCAGGSGTVFPQFTVVEHRGFTSADPVVVTDYGFPSMRLVRLTDFRSDGGALQIEGLAYGPDDQQHHPTMAVAYTLRFDGDQFVMD